METAADISATTALSRINQLPINLDSTDPSLGFLIRPLIAIGEITRRTDLTPLERYQKIATNLQPLGPLPTKIIQTALPFVQLKTEKTADDEAFLEVFGPARTDYGTVDPEETLSVINRSPAVASGRVQINQDRLVGHASVSEIYQASAAVMSQKRLVAKVQKPHAKEQFSQTIAGAKALVTLASTNLSQQQQQMIHLALNLTDSAYRSEFSTADEIKGLQRLRQHKIKAPQPYPDLSSDEIIVMDEVGDATPLSKYAAGTDFKSRRKTVGRYIASLIRMIRHGFIHGDPHGGNVLIDKKNQLHWVDPSPVIDFTFKEAFNMVKLLRNMRSNNKNRIINALNTLAEKPFDKTRLDDLKKQTAKKDGPEFYKYVFKAGLIPPSKTVSLARAFAEAFGTIMELLPEKQSITRWAQILFGATVKSFV